MGCNNLSALAEYTIVQLTLQWKLKLTLCHALTSQDAVEKGWFGSTDQDTDEYTPHLETVAVTAHEIASAMAHLHGQGIVHGVSCEPGTSHSV